MMLRKIVGRAISRQHDAACISQAESNPVGFSCLFRFASGSSCLLHIFSYRVERKQSA